MGLGLGGDPACSQVDEPCGRAQLNLIAQHREGRARLLRARVRLRLRVRRRLRLRRRLRVRVRLSLRPRVRPRVRPRGRVSYDRS